MPGTKPSVSFSEARMVFLDPLALTYLDEIHSEEEPREITIGVSPSGRLLAVVHTERYGCKRIINAREATRRERQFFEEETRRG